MDYEIVIRPKPICEFESIEALRRYNERVREEIERKPIKQPHDSANLRALRKDFDKLREVSEK